MNLPKFNDISLKWKLIIPFLFLAITGATSLFVVSYKFQDSLIHVNELKRLKNQYQFFLNDIEFKRDMAMSLAYLASQNCDVAEAFAHRDRERLIELLQPAYETLHKDFDVQQFHFHTEHATSFLRLHALDCCGEEMESFRHMITEAFDTCNGCSGIEVGTFGFGIRSVVPVFYNDNLVGTLEIGFSVGQPFLENFKHHYGSDAILYVEQEAGAGELEILASTMEKDMLSPKLVKRSFDSGDQLLHAGSVEGRDVAIISGPIYDFSANIKGVVEIVIDRTPTQSLLKEYAVISASIAFIGLILSIAFVWLVSVFFTKRIEDVVKGAEEIAAGSSNARIEVKSRDELGCMSLAINQMLTSLEMSRNRLTEYAQDLEIMVDERTQSFKESEKTYRTLVENVPIVVYMIMPDGTVVFLNKAIEQMLGISPQKLSGNHQYWDSFIHPHDRQNVIAHRKRHLTQGRGLHLDYRMMHKNGQIIYAVDHAVAVFDDNNGFIRMDGIIVDVTVQKQLHEEILQTEELETLSQISSRLAHELRNPLASIGGLTRRLLKSFEVGDTRTKKGDLIIEQVEKLERILQMILTYLAPQSLELLPADLNKVISDAVEGLNGRFHRGDFSIELYLDESIKLMELDSEQMEKCFANLMENAFYRMHQKGKLKVTTQKIGEHASVTFCYNIPFISDDDIHDFFYPFTVSYPFKKDSDNGEIMDIPVCKLIILNHCGVINVSREEDNRLCIDVSLPLKR